MKIDQFHKHEALDRTWLLMEDIGERLMDHPVIAGEPAAYTLAEQAHKALFDLYQLLGKEG